MKLLLVMCVVMVTQVSGAVECPGPYTEYSNSGRCILYEGDPTNFQAARAFCQAAEGGHLMRIQTIVEEGIVSASLFTYDTEIWNGLHDEDEDGVFLFTDGTPIGSHAPWDTPPSLSTGVYCATRQAGAFGIITWYTTDCSNNYIFLCETEPLPPTPPCSAPWTPNPDANTCLRAIRAKRRSYTEASDFCKGLGGDLATKVSTLAERKRMAKLMKFQGHFFLGVDDKDGDGTYAFVDGTALGPQKPFRKGRSPAGRCVTLKRRIWYPKSCTRRLFFICEKPDANTS